ncbi:MAG: cytochrome c [Chloroflexi bacterium]|nr:cytochrome c [Chloroflexota bacterium]
MRKLVILVTLLIAGLFLISCAGAQPTPTPPAPTPPTTPSPTPSAIDAAKLYANNCAVCHGEKRQGVSGLGPALTLESLVKLSDAETKDTILKGIPNTAMAGFRGRLSPEQIDALIQLIKHTLP